MRDEGSDAVNLFCAWTELGLQSASHLGAIAKSDRVYVPKDDTRSGYGQRRIAATMMLVATTIDPTSRIVKRLSNAARSALVARWAVCAFELIHLCFDVQQSVHP